MRALLLLALGGCQLVFKLADDPDAPIEPIDTWVAVTAGFGHTCALDVDGHAFCWGRNIDGELGRMGTGELAEVREVGTTSELWASVITSHRHTCGIKTDNSSWCWGSNDNGQLGNGGKTPSAEPVATLLGATHAITTSDAHTCAIALDRTLSCWGSNSVGELGNGTIGGQVTMPTLVTTDLRWAAVAASTSEQLGQPGQPGQPGSTCAVAEDHTLWCWGETLGVPGTSTSTPLQLGTDTWRTIALGNRHGCGITEAGRMRCWGSNERGQLGNGTTTTSLTPVGALVGNEDLRDWTEVAVNGNHSCGITGGRWFCWGASTTGQLGLDGTSTNAVPVEIGAGTAWNKLAAGVGHTCAVAADRTLWCVGSRGFSQLGDGSSSSHTPRKLEGAWQQIAVGQVTICGITLEGNARCTGDNQRGTLGNGTLDGQRQFKPVDAAMTWTSISPGMRHTCGAKLNRAVCWGEDYVGQATGTAGGPKLSPTPLPSVPATTIAVNGEHTCALVNVADQTMCWGNNTSGQLGRNTVSPSGSPGDIAGNKLSVIEVGEVHTCGITDSDRIVCWGLGMDGRLGQDNGQGVVSTPQLINNTSTFSALSVGEGSSCGITTVGELFCWGPNYSGELGLGDRSVQVVPKQVAGVWTGISVGAGHSCGLQQDKLFCWGSNDRGQLGLASLTEALTPLPVATDISWKSVSAGERVTCAIDTAEALYCWGDNSVGQLGTGDGWSIELVRASK